MPRSRHGIPADSSWAGVAKPPPPRNFHLLPVHDFAFACRRKHLLRHIEESKTNLRLIRRVRIKAGDTLVFAEIDLRCFELLTDGPNAANAVDMVRSVA